MDGEAPSTVRELLLARTGDVRSSVHHAGGSMMWDEHVAASCRRANWLQARAVDNRPLHLGLLSGNRIDMSLWLGGCAIARAVAVGLNPTRSTDELVRDALHTQVLVVLVDEALAHHADGLRAAGIEVIDLDDVDLDRAVAAHASEAPQVDVTGEDLFVLIFTSGTTSEPKAVRCSHGRLVHSGRMVAMMVGLEADDVVLTAMPLFHSNAIIAGWLPAIAAGADLVVQHFSASGFVAALREHGVTYANYVGKALSYVASADIRPGDEELPLRVLFGNEASERTIAEVAARFDCRVMDAYGSTESGISLLRTEATPAGALGVGIGDVRVLDARGRECPRAIVDEHGNLRNADEAIGELVNLDGAGGFEGYWRNPEADAERLRDGHFHSGDLAWRDADGFFWFAGRTGDWVRVDGENLAVAPIERALQSYPGVLEAVVVAVADPDGGDQVLAWLEVPELDRFNADEFSRWCREAPDLPPKAVPRYLRIEAQLPRTPTNKVPRAQLRAQGLAGPGMRWQRPARADHFVPMETVP